MSEQRLYDFAFTRTIARENGKIKTKTESSRFVFYNAGQFSKRMDGINFNRGMPARKSKRDEFYRTHFRVMIDGIWHSPKGIRYQFFTRPEVAELLLDFLIKQEATMLK